MTVPVDSQLTLISSVTPNRLPVMSAQYRWHVSATISSLPALLELALIMFLIGLLIFLWDIHPVVATAVTIVVGIFLAIAMALTVAPLVKRRCPYKSPTAWAIILLWETTKRLVESVRTWSIHYNTGSSNWTRPAGSWRLRDIEGNRTDSLLGDHRYRGKGALRALIAAFRQVEIKIDRKPGGEITQLLCSAPSRGSPPLRQPHQSNVKSHSAQCHSCAKMRI